MERNAAIAAYAVAGLIAAKVLLNLIASPMDAVRAELARELEQVPREAAMDGAGHDFASLQNALAAKPGLWNELVAAPPPPAEAPQAAARPDEPDLAAMLQGVSIGRGQIGADKIRIHSEGAPRGAWAAIGEVIQGCTLVEITPESAIFSYYWREGEKELRIALPRP